MMDWGCHNTQLLSDDAAAKPDSSSQKGPSEQLSTHRPTLQRCLSRLPGRTPVLPRRVIKLRLEDSQQFRDYITDSLHPYGDMKLLSASDDVDDRSMGGNQQQSSKSWPPSRLRSCNSPYGNH